MRSKLLMEGLGTFFLCLSSCLAQGPFAPLAVAAVLMALIYMGGAVSRAHYNPAVTLSFWLRRRQNGSTAVAYVGAQLVAAVMAAVLAGLVHGHSEENSQHILEMLQQPVLAGWLSAIMAECLGTYLIAFVILMVATSRLTAGNSYFGLAIAAAVLGLGSIFAPFSPSFNPAVLLSTTTEGVFSAFNTEGSFVAAFSQEISLLAHATPQATLSLVAQMVGGALAAWSFLGLFPEDR